MSNSKASKTKRSKALPVLGAAGLSLSLASAASAVPSGLGDMPASKTGDDDRVTLGEEDVSFAPFYLFDKESEGTGITLHEEEIADVSLATFYVFDKEGDGTSSMLELVGHGCHGCHGCGGCHAHGCHGCHGCGGCHHGCGCHGCGHACGGCGCVSIGVGCGVGWWGGCGGCGGHWCWWHGYRHWCRW